MVQVDKKCDMWNFAVEELLSSIKQLLPAQVSACLRRKKKRVVVVQSLWCVNCSFVALLLKLWEDIYINQDEDEVLLFRTYT